MTLNGLDTMLKITVPNLSNKIHDFVKIDNRLKVRDINYDGAPLINVYILFCTNI